MQVSIDLQDMFSYSFIPIIICIIIIIFFLIIFVLIIHKPKKVKKISIVKPIDINAIKNKYLLEIDNLLACVNENKITLRHSYQQLSKLIRNFIYEVTGLKVQNYTLSDIKTINMPVLSTLVEEYYHPEFAKDSKGDIITSINKTREVIAKWK